MKEPLLCKIPTREEMERQWNDALAAAGEAGRQNGTVWKEEAIRNALQGYSIPYCGFCGAPLRENAPTFSRRERGRIGPLIISGEP